MIDKILKLKRWNTPTIFNGWEQITKQDASRECFNFESCTDFMPQMGPMIGRAVTVRIQASDAKPKQHTPNALIDYRKYMLEIPGPKIVVVQDSDKPNTFGSFWGEVNSTFHQLAGCVGTITDGAIRDLDEMTSAGLKCIARRLCVGHGHVWPIAWNCSVEVFGTTVNPGNLIHADKHGFLVIPPEDEDRLLEAVISMDNTECETVLSAAWSDNLTNSHELLTAFSAETKNMRNLVHSRFSKNGEW